MLKNWFSFVLLILSLVGLAYASEDETLKPKDIRRIMDQIFSEHVTKKGMDRQILGHALVVYIDQFDPYRMYLLESEVNQYKNLPPTELDQAIEQYKKNDYSLFVKLNQLIQSAIERSRKIREGLETDVKKSLFHPSPDKEQKLVQKTTDAFPSTIDQLKDRILLNLATYIDLQKGRIEGTLTSETKEQILKTYEARLREYENHYLYQDEKGNPLPPQQQENLFAIHVIKALASSLDSHTSYYQENEAFDIRVRLQKEFRGIGIVLKDAPEGIVVTHMLEGGPAEKSKMIQNGDILIEVDGQSVLDHPFEKIMEMLHGEKNTSVKLTFKKKGEADQIYHVELKRELIVLNNDRVDVSSEPFGTGIIGKITLHSFYQGEGLSSEKDVRNAIEQLQKKGSLRGLILDLRENSGGFLSQAVKVAGLFISNGVIVISKYSDGDEHFYRDVDGKEAFDGPLIVLTSKATASAAEIVAQALQDYGVALIVGDEHTYGKGTIQTQTVTDNQSTSYFKVTVGKYYTVSGHTPQKEGVKADIVVPSHWFKEKIGEAYLDSVEPDTIPAAYDDKLQDVPATARPWLLKYYTPTIQHRTFVWRDLLPILKKNSEYRIENNKNYQFFLKGPKAAKSDEDEVSEEDDWESPSKNKTFGEDDLQMQEAVNVLKDMIILHGLQKKQEMPQENKTEEKALSK